MSVANSARYLMETYGDTVYVTCKEETKSGRAVVEPLMYKNKMYLGGNVVPTGYLDNSHYVMTAPPELLGDNPGDAIITYNGQKYVVKRSEIISADDEDLYLWAVLETYGEEVFDEYA
ncbi:MAG: hypothetical protein Q4D44_02655 [Eubacteriales bacterium]|nr:hypothetical protein [Eubacteriales bacterium]